MRGLLWLIRRWETQGFTVEELAKATGISRRTLFRIQRGNGYVPTAATLAKLSLALHFGPRVARVLASGRDVDHKALDAVAAREALEMHPVTRAQFALLKAQHQRLSEQVVQLHAAQVALENAAHVNADLAAEVKELRTRLEAFLWSRDEREKRGMV